MRVRSLGGVGGVAVEGVDLTRLSDDEAREVRRLYDQHGLVVFRGQTLTKPQVVAACAPFGGAFTDRVAQAVDPEAPGIDVISTRGYGGDVVPDDPDAVLGATEWHTDMGYVTKPNRGKILYAVRVPEEGGKTGFIDGQMTYRELPEALRRRIAGLHVVQSWSRLERLRQNSDQRAYRLDGDNQLAPNLFPDVVYPLVHPHPLSGEMVLNLPPMWADGIVELPGAEGEALMTELIAHITQAKFQYWHAYEPGDAVAWDNWRFLHAASGTPGRCVRTIWSVSINAGPEIGRRLEAA